MTTAQPVTGPNSAPTPASTLRARLTQQQSSRRAMNLKQAISVIVPVCVHVAELHAQGHTLFLHPSCLAEDEFGYYHVLLPSAQQFPASPRDRACMAPEQQSGQPGDARSSVYAIGAILYELLTCEYVAPGMARPSRLNASVTRELESILSKALVGDPAHRPDDLNALAQALYALAPAASIRPPPADTSHLDHHGDFEVDVSLSMLPPEPQQPMPAAATAPVPRSAPRDKTSELAALKARLESDGRPRYVVIKDGMDHGPFNAVELLQQIANHTFTEVDAVRDSVSRRESAIKDWPEFAPFAEQAALHRNIRAEKDAIERVVVQESRSTRGKALLGILLVGALLSAAGVWYLTTRGQKSDEIAVHSETLTNVETDAGLDIKKKNVGGKGRRIVGRSGNYPILGGGMSCEAARAAYVEEMRVGGARGQADITAGQYGAILNQGSYFGGCGVPNAMELRICAAVQNGRAVGVSVYTKPRNARIASCVAGSVRRLKFPSHPKLDVTTTVFK